MNILKNEFSWSKTRDDTFNKCNRMYYYRYYGSWDGWLNESDERTKKIYVLKQLQTRQMWAGKKVHECIKKTLGGIQQGEKSVDVEKVLDETLIIMRNEFKDSKRGRYWKEPKTCALFEHEYGIQLPDSEWKNTANHVVECLKNFFDSDVFKLICNLDQEQWLEVEELSTFLCYDVKVFVSLDLAIRKGDKIFIYDWKTGKLVDDAHNLQPSCYCLYAINAFSAKPTDVKVTEFYLSNKKLKEYRFIDSELNLISQYIQKSIHEMRDLLDNYEINLAKEERFSFTEDERVCSYCSFRKLCPKWT